MKTVIIGSEGNVGRRLRRLFPGAIGIDRIAGAEIVADLATIDYDAPAVREALAGAEAVIHVATSPSVDAPDIVHYQAVIDAARLLAACQQYPVPRVMLPSSDWAEPKIGWADLNTYGHSKRVFETMAAMYRHSTGKVCTALRIGWVARNLDEVRNSEQWLQDNYWPDERLFAEVNRALGL
jgi:nucleoside-diphosphate-sugar epimerase